MDPTSDRLDALTRRAGSESRVHPFFFGAAQRQLFGCHHPVIAAARRSVGVVVCAPMGHEALQFHRALGQLAQRLSEVGFPTLRFDYYGCGDSAGACEEGALQRWSADVGLAIDQLRTLEPEIESVGLVGLRVGGTLALLAGAERSDVDALVLWDAVTNGGGYLAELTALQRDALRTAHLLPTPEEEREPFREFLGFPVGEVLAEELRALDLATLGRQPASRALVLTSHPLGDSAALADLLQRLGVAVEVEARPTPRVWAWSEDDSKQTVPFELLQSIVSWFEAVRGR